MSPVARFECRCRWCWHCESAVLCSSSCGATSLLPLPMRSSRSIHALRRPLIKNRWRRSSLWNWVGPEKSVNALQWPTFARAFFLFELDLKRHLSACLPVYLSICLFVYLLPIYLSYIWYLSYDFYPSQWSYQSYHTYLYFPLICFIYLLYLT